MLKILPKPEGFDLRAARAEKSGSARDWLPGDALYSASKQIAEDGVQGAMVVCWYGKDAKGLPIVKYSAAQAEPRWVVSLMADALFEMQFNARYEET